MARRNYSNVAVDTTLVTGITGSATTLDVASATGWPIAPFVLVIEPGTANEELILVGAKTGVTFSSLTRGFGGTSAVAHNAAVPIKHVLVKEDHDLTWTHIHVPGTDDTAQVAHSSLAGITADQHHAQAHVISGADHTGQLDHGVLAGLADDDHAQYLKEKASGGTAAETPTHTHADAANAGTIDHGVLTGLADDDHPQYATDTDLTNHATDNDAHGNHGSLHQSGGTDPIPNMGSYAKMGGATDTTLSGVLTTTPVVGASVTFVKPTHWNSYDIMAWGSAGYQGGSDGAQTSFLVIRIAGQDGIETSQGSTDVAGSIDAMANGAEHDRQGLTADAIVEARVRASGADVRKQWSIVNFLAIRTS